MGFRKRCSKEGRKHEQHISPNYEMRLARSGAKMTDPPEPYWQTVERLFADKGGDHVARLLAYALRDLDKTQEKREFVLAASRDITQLVC